MPETDEGLDVDDLDIEVPTAAKVNVYEEPTTESLRTQYLEVDEVALNHKDELVRRQDHREAIREAVQHGAERERRRIQDKISDLASKHWGGQMKAFEQDWRNAWKELSEELEEEVENTGSRPKTGKSDNFGETRQ